MKDDQHTNAESRIGAPLRMTAFGERIALFRSFWQLAVEESERRGHPAELYRLALHGLVFGPPATEGKSRWSWLARCAPASALWVGMSPSMPIPDLFEDFRPVYPV